MLAFWTLVIAITVWPRHHAIAIVLLGAAGVLATIGLWRVRRANDATDEEEAATAPPPGSDARPIEPAGGWNPRRMLLLPILLIGLLWEFRPLAEAVLGLTPYRLLRAAPDAAPPLRGGDRVWSRLQAGRPTKGSVIGLWDPTHRWRLATVIAATGDTVSGLRPYDWVERDGSDRISTVAYALNTPRVLPSDSIAVTIHSAPTDQRPEAEAVAARDAQAIALRIVFPPSHWRRLP